MTPARLVLLPGMDGTGLLFRPLLEHLDDNIKIQIIRYPANNKLRYAQLSEYVINRLPQQDNYILLAESFSGPIAYTIARTCPLGLKSVIFVAGFLRPPLPFLRAVQYLPLAVLLSLPLPDFIIKKFMLGRDTNKSRLQEFKTSLKQVANDVLAFRMREITNLAMPREQLHLPCSYIQPLDDRLVPGHNLAEFQERITNLQVFPVNGPHFILQARPDVCAGYIGNIIRQITATDIRDEC